MIDIPKKKQTQKTIKIKPLILARDTGSIPGVDATLGMRHPYAQHETTFHTV